MSVKSEVAKILAESYAARNSDRELLLIFMQRSGMGLSARQADTFRQMPSMETIRRVRQSFQEQGLYPASDKVNEARFDNFTRIRGGEDPERVIEKQQTKIELPDGW